MQHRRATMTKGSRNWQSKVLRIFTCGSTGHDRYIAESWWSVQTMQPTRDMTLIWHHFHIFHRRYAHKSTRCAWTWLSFGGLPQASLCIGLTSRFTSQWSQWEGISVWGTTEHLRRHHFSYKVRLATCIPLLYQYDVISYNVGTTIINHK